MAPEHAVRGFEPWDGPEVPRLPRRGPTDRVIDVEVARPVPTATRRFGPPPAQRPIALGRAARRGLLIPAGRGLRPQVAGAGRGHRSALRVDPEGATDRPIPLR